MHYMNYFKASAGLFKTKSADAFFYFYGKKYKMISINESVCPRCGGKTKYYDKIRRIIRTKGRKTNYVMVQRLRCTNCGEIHRKLPEDILPHKQYEAEIIRGVVEGLITCETYGFEDYPCEMTMIRWRSSQELHTIL